MTIKYQKQPYKTEEVENILHPLVKKWFFSRFKSFSLPQLHGVMEIHKRNNILVSAPTGATKTLTGFLSILNELVDSAEKGILQDKVYAVYISPLKALNNDIQLNLLQPLKEIEEIAGKKLGIRIAVRTGDTTQAEKSKMLKQPPHILISTPESLGILLASYKFINHLRDVQYFICDEIHSLAENKRGTHLSLSVERLAKLSSHLCRVGLSATVSPLEDVAKFLVGYNNNKLRNCKIVDVQFIKDTDLKVLSPLKDIINTTPEKNKQAMYDLIHKLIQEHKTTLIFTNTRAATERVVDNLKELYPKLYNDNNIGAHHGSLSKEHRLKIENALRAGTIKTVVCLDGNTKVLDSKGQWIKIKKIEKDYVQSINDKLTINNNKIKNIFKTKNNQPLLKLKTGFGKEIECTKNHKFLTINKKGNLYWKEASNLNQNDSIATIRDYKFKEIKNNELNTFIFRNYPDNYFIFLDKKFLGLIKSNILKKSNTLKEFWKKNIKIFISYSTFIHILLGEFGIRFKILKKLVSILNISEMQTYNSIDSVSSSKYNMKKPQMNKDMMRLIGFMLADGYLSDRDLFVTNKNENLLRYYGNIIRKLSGKKPFKKMGSTGTPILSWSSKFLTEFLKNLGFKQGRKARIVNIPNFIFRLNSDLVFSLLSGYMDGDGYLEVKKGKRVYAAGICTTSKEMAEDISRLLIRESILSSVRSKYCDEIQELNGREIIKKGRFYTVSILGGDNLRKFAEKINPVRQNLKRIKKVLTLNGYTNRDNIPNLGNKLRVLRNKLKISTHGLQKLGLNPIKYEYGIRSISRKQLKRLLTLYQSKDKFLSNLLNSDLVWEKIKSKEEIGTPEFVYNVEVENDHNYIANGFLTKNCSTSLELGIDIGYIDLVVCLGSPKSVARFLQRAGRSGHKLHEKVKSRIIVLDRDDLVECAVLLKSAIEKKIDRLHIPTNALDVLAQQIHGIAIQNRIHINDLYKLVKSSYCYHDLNWNDFKGVVDYLSGVFASLEDRYIYAKIWFDEETGMIGKKGSMSRVIHMTNIGTIPDESFILVKIGEQIIGKLDESFLEKLRPGDVFVLGGSTYVFKYSRGMTAQVSATASRPPTIPRWSSESLPLSFDLANDIGRFRKLIGEKFCLNKTKKEIMDFINKFLYVDENAANSIYQYFYEQFNYAEIPSNTRIVIEHYSDETGKYVFFHSLFGRRVNDCLSRAIAFAIGRTQHKNIEIGINDNGFFIRTQKAVKASSAFKLLVNSNLDEVMEQAIDNSEILKRRFRHCASRALMILRNYKGRRKSVGRQQIGSMILLSAVKRIDKNFTILKEARREVLEDLMDIENAKLILNQIKNKKILIKEIFTRIPSPFAFNLMLQGHSDILKMEDRIEFLQRMHNMVLAKIYLKK